MKINTKNKLLQRRRAQQLGSLLSVAAISISTAAAENAAPPASDDQAGLPSVTVTATRREASLRSVPIAVSVLNGDLLEQANRNSIDSIAAELPSVNFRQQGGNKDSTIFVRGIGTISTSPGVEPTVSTVVDGVVFARPGQATLDLLDIDRIEILRGPQGTLFGKNASSGVLNVVSRKPGKDTAGFIDASYFEGNERRLRAGISGTLVPETVRASLTALDTKYDGNVDNVANGNKVNGFERQGLRAKVLVTPNSDLDITLVADYLRSNSSPTFVAYKSTSAPFSQAIAPVIASTENRQIRTDIPSDISDFNKGVSAQIDWRNQGYTLTSITAARQWDNEQHTTTSAIGNSADISRISAAFPATRDIGTLHYRQFSQELRLASPKDSVVDYVLGAYYLHGKDEETYQRIVTTSATSINSGFAPYSVTSDSYSLFGEGNYLISDGLKAIAGARWTRDELSYNHARTSTQATAFAGVQPATSNAGSTSESAWSGRTGLQYDLSKDISTYATVSRGYKGPAYNVFFNMLNRDTLALKPETSDSYEIGIKAIGFDKKLSVNLAAFQTNYKNYQANFYDTVAGAVVTRLINAGEVSTRGVEIDVEARPVTRLNLSTSLAYIDARIDQFNCPAAAAASCTLNGQTLPFSPKWKSFSRVSYGIPLANGLHLELSADYSWQSKVQFDLFQSVNTIQGSVGLINASIALSSSDNGWRIALIGKNLSDKSYATNLVNSSGYVTRAVPRDDQRYFGITARKDF
ncbi:TonB-dependent receptor [Undibacterium sp. FT147W]|uniref:TonB-dependent receptor n=1 Tax=Undibacterium rivi TaxID=2828729 RepID=A0ABS5H4T0_9BURK|nr:TonB-dependent receptor [Undibacterium rivi]MBR7793848.1 TonB-dependent receptor [Undibacterium rivi]